MLRRTGQLRRSVLHLRLLTTAAASTTHDLRRVRAEVDAYTGDARWLTGELRSNLAGETGAVFIYRGAAAALALASRRAPSETQRFVAAHAAAEERHLRAFEELLRPAERTVLLPLWRASGFALGFAPTALGGERGLYVTVHAVESFVDEHYQEQIERLQREAACPALVGMLKDFRADELHHRDDAAEHARACDAAPPTLADRAWATVVSLGSKAAVAVARRL